MNRIEIPLKLPSLNDYINECRKNRFAGAEMKKRVQRDIGYFINQLPAFKNTVRITFTWIEANRKRDLDNVCFAKKFILDALQECGKLQNDNRKWVAEFTDRFKLGNDYKVILEIEEIKNENIKTT